MADVFISYRRDDSRSATGRLTDSLQAAFGPQRIFRDLDSIAPGQDFEAALARAIDGTRVMLAVIGPRWLELRDKQGRRRLDVPEDPVRREIEAALAADLPIIPVLVEGASMPAAEVLPASLAMFARSQAAGLTDADWHAQIARLVDELEQRHGVERTGAATAPARAVSRLLEAAELMVRPRRVILRLAGEGGRNLLARAALLLTSALLLGNVLIGAPLESDAAGLVAWVLGGTLLDLVATAWMAVLVALAWRVAGAAAGWQRLACGVSCLVAGGWLYFAVGLMVFEIGLAVAQPDIFDTLSEHLRRRAQDGAVEWLQLPHVPVRGAALVAIVLSTTIWLPGFAWLLAAWAALRVALDASWGQLLVATAMVCATLGALAYAVLRVTSI